MVLIEPTILHVPSFFTYTYIHKQTYYFINLQIWDLNLLIFFFPKVVA